MFIISIEGSLTLIGVLPGAATFAKSGWGKIRAERPFRLTLLRWGLPSLAKPDCRFVSCSAMPAVYIKAVPSHPPHPP